jgi:hypothetical protein
MLRGLSGLVGAYDLRRYIDGSVHLFEERAKPCGSDSIRAGSVSQASADAARSRTRVCTWFRCCRVSWMIQCSATRSTAAACSASFALGEPSRGFVLGHGYGGIEAPSRASATGPRDYGLPTVGSGAAVQCSPAPHVRREYHRWCSERLHRDMELLVSG